MSKEGRPRKIGPLEPLFRQLPVADSVAKLAELLEVSRQTIYRWQQGEPISPYHQLRINRELRRRRLPAMFAAGVMRTARRPTSRDKQTV